MDQLPIIDDMAAPVFAISTAARPRQQRRGPKAEIEPVILQPDAQAVADQAGRDRVEDPLQEEAAGRRARSGIPVTFVSSPKVCAGLARTVEWRLQHGTLASMRLRFWALRPTAETGCRTSPRTATGRKPGSAFSIGTIAAEKYSGQGIGPPPVSWCALLRGRLPVPLQTVARGSAETGLGRNDGRRVGPSILHEEPHLMIGYRTAGHERFLFEKKSPPS